MGTRTSFAAIVENEGSFRAWYDDALPRVYRYLLARCGDELLAEELTQQTFVDGVRRRDRFDGRSDVVTWLCAIGRNKLVDHYRRAGRNERRMDRLIAQQRVASDRHRPRGSCPSTTAVRRARSARPRHRHRGNLVADPRTAALRDGEDDGMWIHPTHPS